jgi:hypothetical protein
MRYGRGDRAKRGTGPSGMRSTGRERDADQNYDDDDYDETVRPAIVGLAADGMHIFGKFCEIRRVFVVGLDMLPDLVDPRIEFAPDGAVVAIVLLKCLRDAQSPRVAPA